MRPLLAAAAFVVLLAPRAWPQDHPRSDLFAGYSLVREDGESLHGGELAFAYHFSGLLAVATDLDWHTHTVEGTDHTTAAALIGPRLSFASGALRPFVHLLVGAVRDRDSIQVFSQTISESHTNVGGAAGGGADVGRGRVAARLQADYRFARRADETGKETLQGDLRFSVGVVLRMGAR
jgi:hypothetical protein